MKVDRAWPGEFEKNNPGGKGREGGGDAEGWLLGLLDEG